MTRRRRRKGPHPHMVDARSFHADLAWIEEAGVHLWAAINLYRAHEPPGSSKDPDQALIQFLYSLQDPHRDGP